eukprot:m.124345 g.124345  ORF g.124345 m.124345 type:complete len:52 (+) comp52175_c0_seq3:1-156(+)
MRHRIEDQPDERAVFAQFGLEWKVTQEDIDEVHRSTRRFFPLLFRLQVLIS